MRLDASVLDLLKTLSMRNHEWVPGEVIGRISRLRGGETFKVLRKLLKNKFVVHTGKNYDGYKLTYLGYDYLALQTFLKRGILKDVICKIGVGKQSDIYKCITPEGDTVVLKLTRLGRNSFRSIKKNRQYIGTRTNYNWLYLSRLSSVREFLFMQLLNENNFTTPRPIDTNRHAIVMSLVEGSPLCHITRIGSQQEIKVLFEKARDMLIKFAENGLIHGDYNEFNLITNDQGTKLTVIDFPQCVSVNHPNADMYFSRDVECIYKFFDKMVQRQISENGIQEQTQQGDMNKKKKWILNVSDYPMPVLSEIQVKKRLDRQLKTKGHITLTEQKELQKAYDQVKQSTKQENQDSEQEGSDNQQELNQQQEENGSQGSKEEIQQNENVQKIDFNQKEMKKMSFEGELELQEILSKPKHQHQSEQIYDKELQSLMSELNHVNLQPQFSEENLLQNQQNQEQDSEQEQRPEFKGLTAYQVRQKIKEEKRLEREKRKNQMTEDQYIKNAVKKIRRKDNISQATKMIGNRGNKKKNRMNADNIKYGYEW